MNRPQMSDMSLTLWILFTLALLWWIGWIVGVVICSYKANKHPYKSKEWREWDSVAFLWFILGALPALYWSPFILIPFGLFDLP